MGALISASAVPHHGETLSSLMAKMSAVQMKTDLQIVCKDLSTPSVPVSETMIFFASFCVTFHLVMVHPHTKFWLQKFQGFRRYEGRLSGLFSRYSDPGCPLSAKYLPNIFYIPNSVIAELVLHTMWL